MPTGSDANPARLLSYHYVAVAHTTNFATSVDRN